MYDLTRGVVLDRHGQRDIKRGLVYLYSQMSGGFIEVRKIPEVEARGLQDVLDLEAYESKFDAAYIISPGGVCDCPGFDYRGSCRHVDKMRERGWLAAV
jgi:hypothetical protein